VTCRGERLAGGRDFITWWLDQMKAARRPRQAARRRIDSTGTPEATGGGVRIIDDGTGAAEVAAREQSPAVLWDSDVHGDELVTASSTMGPINLIPREQAKIRRGTTGHGAPFTE